MASWQVPEGMEGHTGLVRVQASSARPADQSCPQRDAARAHPAVLPQGRPPRKPPGLQHFALEPVNRLIDMVEFDDLTLGQAAARLSGSGAGAALHAGMLCWATHAASQYLAAAAAIGRATGAAARPVSREWVLQSQVPGAAGNVTYELCAWGRRYETADGRMRELRVPRTRSVDGRPRELAEIAVAAHVVAGGRVALSRPRPGEAYRVGGGGSPEVIRIVEVGCEDGSWQLLFDGTAADAKRMYDEHSRQRLRSAVSGGRYRPGEGCPDCKLLAVCPAVPQRPGLLGISDAAKPVRSWSVTNGRRYRTCPAQDYLHRLYLPLPAETQSSAVHRGQAVHAWLAGRHARAPLSACTADDVPDVADCWSAGGWQVSGNEARLGVQMIGDHALVCPLRGLPPGAVVLPEHRLTVHDPAAGVVIIAKTDLLYQDGGGWVLRETKTTRQPDEGNLLERYPQLALAVTVLAEGIPGGSRDRNRVELERLTPAGPMLEVFRPADPYLHAQARRVVHELAVGWHADTRAIPSPGEHCQTCDVSRWCPDAAATARDRGPG
jgi:PD-(D/E)XK nuclease superfamily